MAKLPDENLQVAYYSVLRYVADPFRDEPVNVGLFLVTEDGSWSRFRAHPPKTKLRNLNRRNDVERIERWAANLREVLDLEGPEFLSMQIENYPLTI